jgi:aminopeptidase
MPDPRLAKWADVLINYSLAIRPGQQLVIDTAPLADELTLASYAAAIKAGAHVFINNRAPGADEILLKCGSDGQLDHVSPVRRLIFETFDARLTISAEHNTRAMSGVDPSRQARRAKAMSPLMKLFLERSARRELRWCLTEFPTDASAQDADMSLGDYQEFVYGACLLTEPDPAAAWRRELARQEQMVAWLKGRAHMALKGADIDLRLSIKDRPFIPCGGDANMPDGEIFAAPVEDSVSGWVRFRYPAIYGGKEVSDIELWFENGKVVKETAGKGQDLLTSMLNTDAGARVLGELGIGTNYGIQRFTKNMLFDEKIGGTFHLAVGSGYPESGSANQSAIHWDMLCDMAASEVTVDGDVFYKDGKPVI